MWFLLLRPAFSMVFASLHCKVYRHNFLMDSCKPSRSHWLSLCIRHTTWASAKVDNHMMSAVSAKQITLWKMHKHIRMLFSNYRIVSIGMIISLLLWFGLKVEGLFIGYPLRICVGFMALWYHLSIIKDSRWCTYF